MDWLGTWAKRIPITFDSSVIDSDQSNFPFMIKISASSGKSARDLSAVFSDIPYADRKKIAVTGSDGQTQRYVEIELWDDVNQVAILHVKVLTLVSASDDTGYLYFDPAQSDNTTYIGDTGDAAAQNVWDANFLARWGMRDDPDNQSVKDSTSNAFHGTKGAAGVPAEVDGQVGKGQNYTSTSDRISVATGLLVTGAATIEVLIKPNSFATTQDVFARMANTGAAYLRDASLRLNNGKVEAITANEMDQKYRLEVSSLPSLDLGSYAYIGYTVADVDGDLNIFVDLTDDARGTGLAPAATNGNIIYQIGNLPYFNRAPIAVIDEVRFSSTVRSAAWRKATYYSLNDQLLTFGSIEVLGGGGTELVDMRLHLSAYYQSLEDLRLFLMASDGTAWEDLKLRLQAAGWTTEDLTLLMTIALQSLDDMPLYLSVIGQQLRDLQLHMAAYGRCIEDLRLQLIAAGATKKDLKLLLSAVSSTVLADLVLYLSATDGWAMNDLKLRLSAVRKVPAFQSVLAQRLSSIMNEVV